MTRLLLPLILFILSALAAGWATLNAVPGVIMNTAMERIEATGAASGGVRHAPRLREDNQTIVRASPDMLYSVCAYDLSRGDLSLTIPWPADGNYASVSFYDARTNNFAVLSDRQATDSLSRITLSGRPEGSDGTLFAPTDRGLALYRRVIDAATDLEAAEAERRGFTCTVLTDQ